MAYEMVMPYHLHMPSYFLETFTEYPYIINLWADFIHTTYYINGNQKFKKSDALYIRVRPNFKIIQIFPFL